MPDIFGSVLKSVIPALAGGVASNFIANQFLDSSVNKATSPLSQASNVAGFMGGGLIGGRSGNSFVVGSSPLRDQRVLDLRKQFMRGSLNINNLEKQVTPGFGRLTQARVNAIGDARRRTIGDLRENLSRRRILGSSFANDAETRASAEFAKLEEEARAQSFLEELDLSSRLIDRQTELNVANLNAALSELNLQGNAAAALATNGANIIANLAGSQAEILSRAAASQGDLFAPTLNTIQQGVSQATQNIMNSFF